MNELITVTYENDRPAVSARDLHALLEVGADFRHWFPRMCEYGFEAGRDFNPVKIDRVQNEGGRTVTRTVDDAILTLDMAKELCMLQRSEKGKQARQYFIQLEKDWNSPEKVMARASQIADRKIRHLEQQAREDAPKVLFSEAVSASKSTMLIGELAKVLKQNGIEIGQTRLFAWMRSHGFLIRRAGSDYNMPTQKAMEMGLFEIKETAVTHSDGHVTVSRTPKVTGKGSIYFVNRFLKDRTKGDRQ